MFVDFIPTGSQPRPVFTVVGVLLVSFFIGQGYSKPTIREIVQDHEGLSRPQFGTLVARTDDLKPVWAKASNTAKGHGIAGAHAPRKKLQNDHGPNYRPAIRKCMTCRKDFPSEGSHNRMCDDCRGGGEFVERMAARDEDFARAREELEDFLILGNYCDDEISSREATPLCDGCRGLDEF